MGYGSRTSESRRSVFASLILLISRSCSCLSRIVLAKLKQDTVMNRIPIPKNALIQMSNGAAISPTMVAEKESTNPVQTRKFHAEVLDDKLLVSIDK